MLRILKWALVFSFCVLAAFAVSWAIYMPDSKERGVWINPATGNIMDIGRFKASLYNQTAATCLHDTDFPAHMGLVNLMEGASIQSVGQSLELILDTSIDRAKFERVDALPAACMLHPDSSPKAVFDAMWAAMDENYAFFDLHQVDWAERRALAPAPDSNMSNEALFELFKRALNGLDDGHIQLIAGELGFYSPRLATAWMPNPELSREDLSQIARENIKTPLTVSTRAPMEFGIRSDGVGYLLIKGMWANDRVFLSSSRASELAFAEAADALSDAKGIIIDVRYNPGGNDGTAFAYAGYFSQDVREVFYKQTRAGDGWTPRTTATLRPAPSDKQLSQPIVLLTSDLTGSGAEIFTMAMRDLPQVTTMGEATDGGLSDIHGLPLPNGWRFGLSNQEYRTMDGSLYEKVGLPVDIEVATTSDALLDGQDTVLQEAISFLNMR